MLDDLVARSKRKLAIGVDTRTSGFDADLVLRTMDRLRTNLALRPNWCLPGLTKSRCCAAIPNAAAPSAWRHRTGGRCHRAAEVLTAPLREGRIW
jgi:hypothetical protein